MATTLDFANLPLSPPTWGDQVDFEETVQKLTKENAELTVKWKDFQSKYAETCFQMGNMWMMVGDLKKKFMIDITQKDTEIDRLRKRLEETQRELAAIKY
jgi:predicted RNase H-like nuclease (RuvC/YqgF family)